jgi:hypothetical protein
MNTKAICPKKTIPQRWETMAGRRLWLCQLSGHDCRSKTGLKTAKSKNGEIV